MKVPPRFRRLGQIYPLLGRFARRGIILTCHRIAGPDADPWRLAVSPERFAGHLEVLHRHARPVTLEELAARKIDRDAKPAVAVTSDDGYASNLSVAKPALERYGIPATVFVCSGYLEKGRAYWWDELASILLRPARLPSELVLEINSTSKQWRLGAAAEYSERERRYDQDRTSWDDRNQSPRLALYFKIWRELQTLTHQRHITELERLSAWAGDGTATQPHGTCTLA